MALSADAEDRPAHDQPGRRRPRPVRTGHLARWSRFVNVMKVLLPTLAAVLLGLVMAWPRLAQDDNRFQVGFAKLAPKDVESLTMVNARYFGVDDDNKPFAVSAEQATQVKQDQIALQTPKADFTSSGGANVVVDADTGTYFQQSKLLELRGNVSIYHDAGYELHTEAAMIDLGRNSATGDRPVNGHGPQGNIQSQGFELRDKGHEVVFTGKSKLMLRGAGHK